MKNLCFAIVLSVGASLFAGPMANAQTVIADLYNDFVQPANTGWSYLWNPSGVTIGDSANYVPIPGVNAVLYAETAAADAVGTAGGNGNYVSFHQAGNTLSIRVIGGLDASASSDGLDHYAIARYTIQPGEEGDVTFNSIGPDSAAGLPTGINFNSQSGGNIIAAYKNDVLIGTVDTVGVAQFGMPVDFDFGTCAVGDTLDLAFFNPDGGLTRNQRRFFIGGAGFTHTFTSTPSTGGCLLGDVDLNGSVEFLDIQPFIAVLSSSGFQCEADCNEDGMVTFLDIQAFIAILSAP